MNTLLEQNLFACRGLTAYDFKSTVYFYFLLRKGGSPSLDKLPRTATRDLLKGHYLL